jgi:hypothetical protein
MDKVKKHRLEAKGWRVGGVDEFLNLTPEEKEYIDLIRSLIALGASKKELARIIGSSFSP